MIKNARIVCKEANPLDYFAQDGARGTPGFIMSNSGLSAFASCPARWLAGYTPPDSEAKKWGSLLDCVFLTPGQFGARYAVEPTEYEATMMKCPVCGSMTDSQKCAKCKVDRVMLRVNKPWNNNSDVAERWIKEQGQREIIKATLLEAAEKAAARLNADATLKAFREASDTQVWLAAEWHDPATGIIVPIRILVDLAPRAETEFADCLGDLKSSRNAAPMAWQRWCHTAGYHRQGALYLDVWNAATGEERVTFCFMLQENYEPWQPARRQLAMDFVVLGRNEYRAQLENYCACLKHNHWPDYDDHDEALQGWTVVRPEPWMAERAQFAPRYNFEAQDEAPGTEPTDEESFEFRS